MCLGILGCESGSGCRSMNTLIEAVLFLCQETFRENALQVTTLQSNRLQAQDICQLITYWHLLINIILRLLSFLYYMHPNYKIYIYAMSQGSLILAGVILHKYLGSSPSCLLCQTTPRPPRKESQRSFPLPEQRSS